MEVRRAGAADADAVTRHWISLTEHHARIEPLFGLRSDAAGEVARLVEAILRDPDSAVFLGDAGPGSGLCIVRVDRAPPIHAEETRGEITDLFVEPAARRSGLGVALVAAAEGWLRDRGVARVEVRVAVGNGLGRDFWQASGFAPFVDVLHRRL